MLQMSQSKSQPISELLEHRVFPLVVPQWLAEHPPYIENNFCDIDECDINMLINELGELNKPSNDTYLRHGDMFVGPNDYRGDNTIIWDQTEGSFVILYLYVPKEDPNIDYDPPHPSFPVVKNRKIQPSGYQGHYGTAYLDLNDLVEYENERGWINTPLINDNCVLHLNTFSTTPIHQVHYWSEIEDQDQDQDYDYPCFYITRT